MMEGLRFNICDIPDSHKRNSDYEDLSERVLSSISIPLSYSCRFWALHVSWTGFDSSLARKVEEFLYYGFLLWLEVLSLVKAVIISAKLMSGLIPWSSGEKSHMGLYDFAVDGKRFVRLFGDAIAVSAPHVYLSALPFCPQNSIIYKTYIEQFPNTLRITSEPICDWSLASTGSDVGYINCISFSHGGEYLFISLFSDWGVFKLLDSEIFDILWTKKVPDNQFICTGQFSPGDRTLVLATQTKVYLFDILMGDLTLHWEFQLTYGEMRLSRETTFSQNARYIAFLDNSSLIIWNLEAEEETINIPFDNQYRHRAGFAFLSGGTGHFVTYFVDIGAQVWDLETSTVLHGPFQPPQNLAILYTTVSPNGKDIFLLDDARHLHKWNFRDKSLMAFDAGRQPLIDRVSISPNGDCVITESLGRLALRDMNGNELHCEVDSYGFCQTFSKDGKHLASCERGRLNIWELDGWQTTPNIQQSTLPLDRLQFQTVSLDGKYVFAHNAWPKKRGYEIWDVELGRSIRKLNHFASRMLPIFSPLSRYLAYLPDRQAVTVYDIHSGNTKEFKFLPNDEQVHIQGLAFSQDETRIATLDLSLGRICIWDIASCQIVNTLTIPKAKVTATTTALKFWSFIASSNFRYFAYAYLKEHNITLLSGTRSIPLNFLICEQSHSWDSEDFLFSLDEEYMLVTCRSTIFHINLFTKEHRAVALQGNHVWGSKRIHLMSSSEAVLVESNEENGYNIWNAFSGELLYSALLDYPDTFIDAFIPAHQYLFTQTSLFCRILTLDAKRNDLISFSSNEQHSLKNSLPGSSARLRQDGWVITQNEILFWVPSMYHQTLYTPRLKYIIGGKSTELDLSSFSHGQSWTSCRVAVDNTNSE